MSRLDLPMALAAYNAGEATIRRYGGLPPFPETQTYVRNILAASAVGRCGLDFSAGPGRLKGWEYVPRNRIIPCESTF